MSIWSKISSRIHDDHAWIAAKLHGPTSDGSIKVSPELLLVVEDYARRDRSGYAVLVSGEWGAGKTTQVIEALKTTKPSVPFVHVSLYGLSTENDIKSAIVASTGPEKHKTSQALKGLEKSLSGLPIIKGFTDGVFSNLYVNKIIEAIELDTVFVFDDLERFSKDNLDIALGFINKLIEREGRRVIVLAYEDRIVHEISGKKEKIFGRHVRIEPEVESALDRFTNSIDITDDIRSILTRNRRQIADLFRLSEIKSLRVLHHAIADWARLLSVFDAEALDQTDIIDPLGTTIIVFGLEFRAERISESDIEKYAESWALQAMGTPKEDGDKKAQSLQKYFGLHLQNVALSLSTIARFVARGAFDATQVKRDVSEHIAARREQRTPPWRIISDLDSRETSEIEGAIEDIERMLAGREIIDIGDLLHTCSLMMLMSSIGHSRETVQSTLTRFKDYIDDLQDHKILVPAPLDAHARRGYKDAAHGYGYWVTPEYESEFSEFYRYLDEKRGDALISELRAAANELIIDLRSNVENFVSKITYTDRTAIYESAPILSFINVSDFWQTFLSVPKRDWERVQFAIANRIDRVFRDSQLAAERTWLQNLRLLIDREIDGSSGLDRYRLQRFRKFGQFDKIAPDVSLAQAENGPPVPE